MPINGNNSNNTLTGTAGDDEINGYGGKDTINAGAGNDTLYGGNGNDSLNGQDGNDIIYGDDGNDIGYGGAGDDSLYGGVGNDNLSGDDGNDLLEGGAGNDTLTGGNGSDTVTYAYAGNGVTVNLTSGTASVSASDIDSLFSIENVIGSAYADSITGNTQDNTIISGAGNDTIYAGAGNDYINAGASDTATANLDFNWTLAGTNGQNIAGGVMQDTGGVNVAVSFTNDGNATGFQVDTSSVYVAPSETFSPTSNLYLTGTGAGDTSTTRVDFSGPSTYDGQVTNVQFRLNDIDMSSGNWQDVITITAYDADGNAVPVTITISGNDTASGNVITAANTADSANSAQGSALITIPGPVAYFEIDYNNTYASGQVIFVSDIQFVARPQDNDYVDAGAGNDTIVTGVGDDSVLGGTGNDLVYGGIGNDTLLGEDGNDSILGGDGDDSLIGGAGDDTINGGAGADYFNGGAGMDYADYTDSNAGVTVDLAAQTGLGGHAQGDTVVGMDGIYGSAHDDVLLGYDGFSANPTDPYTNFLYGNAGNDYLDGRDGDDSLYGGADNDTILGGGGNDLLDGGSGHDLLYGGDGDDRLYGGDGRDTLDGGTGADLIYGGADEDYIYGDIGDTVDGGDTGADFDTLDLTAWGKANTNIYKDLLNPQNGYVEFLDSFGTVIGTMTFSEIETIIPCFTPGTLIATDRGEVPVEALQPGDLVLTRDNGLQPLVWVGRKDLSLADLVVTPALCPVQIAKGAMGRGLPERDMRVSPQHRMLVEGPRAEMLFAEAEVLVAATHLLGQPGVRQDLAPGISYIHIMFAAHEIVCSDGVWSESFQPAARMLGGMDDARRTEILTLFPDLDQSGVAFPAARLTLKAHEARVLLAA
ncbi:MAG: Hint domain-containing protein [Paracoccaceae bacterium]